MVEQVVYPSTYMIEFATKLLQKPDREVCIPHILSEESMQDEFEDETLIVPRYNNVKMWLNKCVEQCSETKTIIILTKLKVLLESSRS